jgi:hypothetical protein
MPMGRKPKYVRDAEGVEVHGLLIGETFLAAIHPEGFHRRHSRNGWCRIRLKPRDIPVCLNSRIGHPSNHRNHRCRCRKSVRCITRLVAPRMKNGLADPRAIPYLREILVTTEWKMDAAGALGTLLL